jgi:hypothetical protein
MAAIDLEPSYDQLTFDRMGSHQYRFTTEDHWGAPVSLVGYTLHLWLAVPQPNNPVPFVAQHVTPAGGYTITSTQVKFTITEADVNGWGLGPDSYPGQLLASNDGGATTETVWIGNFRVNSGWISNTF